MPRTIISGEPGQTWTNTTGKVLWQLRASLVRTCGVCLQYHLQVGPWWPIPFHHGCHCRQTAVAPGAQALPFADFREVIAGLGESDRVQVLGRASLRLVETGAVKWEDVVTSTRVRTLREVIDRQGLSAKDLAKAGIDPHVAAKALGDVLTPAHLQSDFAKAKAIDQLRGAGLTKQEIVQQVSPGLAKRFGIGAGPSGAGKIAPKPSPTPKTPPKPPTPDDDENIILIPPGGVDPDDLILLKPPDDDDFTLTAPVPPKPKPAAVAAPKPAPKPVPPPKPKTPTSDFPDDHTSLKVVRKLGGSTGAELVEDEFGRRFVRKTGASADHLREEAFADELYRAAGIEVPKSRIYGDAKGLTKLAEFVEGKSLAELRRTDPAAAAKAEAKIRKSFAADALLGNWDVIGLDADNVLVRPDGSVLRIDNGGSLRFRAQGAQKSASQWNGIVGELQTLRSKAVNPSAARVFGGLTDDQVRAQVNDLLKRRNSILAAAPADLRKTLKARLDYLEGWANPVGAAGPQLTPTAPKAFVPRPAKDFRRFDDRNEMEEWGRRASGEWAKTLSPDERRSLENYTGSGYTWMNEFLRDGTVPGGISEATARRRVEDAAAPLRRGKSPEDLTTWRGVKDARKMGFASSASFKPGDQIPVAAFESTSLNRKKGLEFAYPGLGETDEHSVLFQIHMPKGSTGAYVNAGNLSKLDDEREWLAPPGVEYRVVGLGPKVKNIGGTESQVVIVERVK